MIVPKTNFLVTLTKWLLQPYQFKSQFKKSRTPTSFLQKWWALKFEGIILQRTTLTWALTLQRCSLTASRKAQVEIKNKMWISDKTKRWTIQHLILLPSMRTMSTMGWCMLQHPNSSMTISYSILGQLEDLIGRYPRVQSMACRIGRCLVARL